MFFKCFCVAQNSSISGTVTSESGALEFATIFIKETSGGTITDSLGRYSLSGLAHGTYTLTVSAVGYLKTEKVVSVHFRAVTLDFHLEQSGNMLDETVVTGTMKEVSKLESAVPVEVYSAKFFKANPTPSIFESLQNINGVRPQLNCNVCNTGDIHINGLEGPYTMVLIDGMPIVSGLSSVYGLSGIPQSLIDRVEIVKGPASTLYGSEAVGGLINIITKKPFNSPLFSADIFGTSWAEINTDIGGRIAVGKEAEALLGINYFNYQLPVDNNNDGFTDVTLQNRISLFNKWNFQRKNNKLFSVAARYVYEDRWGGDMRWNNEFRGGDSIYGESIYTNRWELFGVYQLPVQENIQFRFSANGHNQNSVYGNMFFLAEQVIGFSQMTWNKTFGKSDILIGASYRYTFYDDNTVATAAFDTLSQPLNLESITHLPGLFVQNEFEINDRNTLLLAMRYDYNSIHGNIITPRINYKYITTNRKNVLRISFGNGYRVANIFTEDHAALTGSREVEFLEDIKPETSWNGNLNFVRKIFFGVNNFLGLDGSIFYTYFNNKIIADYETDPNKILYNNLSGYAVSKGLSLNIDLAVKRFKFLLGGTLMDVFSVKDGLKKRQLFTEKFTAIWSISYELKKYSLKVDYTGNVYSPMRLPLLSYFDIRREFSPWWSIQNIQITKRFRKGFEIYGGVKNLFNWTPNVGNPFIIARSHDPFDKDVQFDNNGNAMVTSENPYGLTFDPTYVYGPNQGIRAFLGIRYSIN